MSYRNTNGGWVAWLAFVVVVIVVAAAFMVTIIEEHHKLVVKQAEWQTQAAEHAIHAYETVYIGFAADFDKAVARIEVLERKLGERNE
jgi:hypothetical protein